MSRAQAIVYLIAMPGYYVSFALMALLADVGDGPRLFVGILQLALAACCSAVFAVAVMRVQRGEVAAEREGVLGPIMAEFILMSVGARLPLAIASFKGRSPV